MKRYGKRILSLLLALWMALALVACGEKEGGGPQGGGSRKTEVVMWSNWGGTAGESLQRIADSFNEAQTQYYLNLTYAGSYEEILAKFQATGKGQRPDLVCTSTEMVAFYADNPDYYVPIQKYIDEDKWSTDDIISNLRVSYSDEEGNMMCAPLGNTVVGFFYNTKLLQDAGIDPKNLNSLEEIAAACDKLKAAGVETPFYIQGNSIYYTFPITAQGLDYVDNENGKSALCTRSLINEEPLKSVTDKFFRLLHSMAEKGQLGSMEMSWSDAMTDFSMGKIALLSGTISGTVRIGEAVNWAMDFGFHPMYTIEAGTENYGQCTGGGAIFIGNNGNEAKERGAWEFLKHVMSTENTVDFAMATGYLPTTVSGWNSETYQTWVQEHLPSAIDSFNAQAATGENCYNAMLPMFNDFAQECIAIMRKVTTDLTYAPETATRDLADSTDECIELYTMSKK